MSSSVNEFDKLRIPYQDVASATNYFAYENLIKEDRTADVYKGKLFQSGEWIDVAVRRVLTGRDEFLKEIEEISSIKHKNFISFVGFCDENGENIIIMKYADKGSLEQYLLSDPTTLLSWSQRLKICLGVTRGFQHMTEIWRHDPSTYTYRYRNIGCSKILVDKDGEAKIACFGLPKIKYGDMICYPLGLIYLQLILFGRESDIAAMAEHNFAKEKLDESIDPCLRKQIHPVSFSIFLQKAYDCLTDRFMYERLDETAKGVEKALEIQLIHENIVREKHYAFKDSTQRHKSGHRKLFPKIYPSGYEKIYKAELGPLYGKSWSTIEGSEKSELFKRQITVGLQCISYDDLEEPKRFFDTLKMLFSFKHPNIVSILGYSWESSKVILVFEYPLKGRLHGYHRNSLTWEQRVRISLDVAHGLDYIYNMKDNLPLYGRGISSNIFLDDKWNAKIYVGVCNFDVFSRTITKLEGKNDFLKSFGLRVFDILTPETSSWYGEFDYVGIPSEDRYAYIRRRLLVEEAQREKVDHHSLYAFSSIAYHCFSLVKIKMDDLRSGYIIKETQAMKIIIRQLGKAIFFQEHLKDVHEISLEAIELGTVNFSEKNCVITGEYWKLYSGELQNDSGRMGVFIKRLNKSTREDVFLTELEILYMHNHENIIGVVGYCKEDDEKIVVYEHASNGSLIMHMNKVSLGWIERLKICIDVAITLHYLHEGETTVIHRNIKSSNILLNNDYKAKIIDFGISLISPIIENTEYLLDPFNGTPGYFEHPLNREMGSFSKEYDIYSFGVVAFEILSGRLLFENNNAEHCYLHDSVKMQFEEGKVDELVFVGIKEQIAPESLAAFQKIAYQCLSCKGQERPTAAEVIIQLQKALEIQESWPGHLERLKRLKCLEGLQCLKIRLSEIMLATNNFDKAYIIGSGGYSEVYKAELNIFYSNPLEIESMSKYELPRKRKTVAIKRILMREDEQGKDGFFVELLVLSNLKHPNIVSLLGYCDEDSEMILVYEHLANGSLNAYLESINDEKKFTWSQRMKMCLDIAYGIDYLHSTTMNKEKIIHRDIKSDNILLGDNWEVKIADFGLSKVCPINQSESTIITKNIAGTPFYIDPEYERYRKLKKASDIYSFGVVLFEILCGRLAYDSTYRMHDTKGLPAIARKHFKQGTLKEIVDPQLVNEAHEDIPTLQIGPSQDSLDTFSKIAYRCLSKTQDDRPTIEDVINELQSALNYQEHRKDILKISLEDMKLSTENFSDKNCILTGDFGKVYSGEIQNDGKRMTVFIKRWRKFSQESAFVTELEVLCKRKHENVISVVGYCKENDERIIVYEHAFKGSLSMHLNKVNLGWIERLKISIGVASGLHFLHEGVGMTKEMVIHRDLKSSSILLSNDYKPKISDFGHSLIIKNKEYVVDNFIGTLGYCEYPLYMETGFLSKESDIYSLGVVLFEILSGRLTSTNYNIEHCYLDDYVKKHFVEGKLDDLVFQGIKEQIAPLSLAIFQKISYQCLHHMRETRPTAGELVIQLRKALEIQEKWELTLPEDDVKTIQLPIDSNKSKNKSYNVFPKEIPLQEWLDGGNGERTEMVSATEFSYINHSSHRWQSLQESRFQRVAEMLDTSDLMIEIKTRTQNFSGDYGIYLVFKFRDSRKFSSQPMYVNLKYKMGSETFHAYFATWREDGWMIIELLRILNDKEDANYTFLLERFSQCYCGDDAIYVEGIEFRAIDNVKNIEGNKTTQETQQVSNSNLSVNQVQQWSNSSEEMFRRSMNYDDEGEKNIWRSEVSGKKHLILAAKEVLLKFPNEKLFTSRPSTQSRFEDEIELLPEQVFHINCTIKSQMLSQDTEYVCYLVFKLSGKFDGLHNPVKVQDLLQENKEAEIIYFTTPSPWNIHVSTRLPKQREDGLMEVIVWKFNLNHYLENDCVPVKLKLMSYEESMSGLIMYSIEFRPM